MNLGKYEILEELGRGGFGIVYKAKDTVLNRLVAIKVLRPNLVNDPTFLVRFKQEAQIAAQLDHPNLVPVYDFGQEEGRYYIAMGYMSGGSMKELLAKEGKLNQEKAMRILGQVAEGLEHAHGRGIVHRDLKPGNILFDASGNARISDMGFAKLLSSDSSASMSASGGLIGTPAYMAPEIWKGQPAIPATDLYSLACILVEMLSGKTLFEGDTTPAVMMKHFEPVQLPASIPNRWAVPIKQALEVDPVKRIKGAKVFVSRLRGSANPPPLKDDPAEHPVHPSHSKRSWKPVLVIAAVGLVLVMAILAGRSFLSNRLPGVPTVQPTASVAIQVTPEPTTLAATATLEPVEPTPGVTLEPTSTLEVIVPTPTITPEPTPTLGIGTTRLREVDGMEMVFVPAGAFMMRDEPESSPYKTADIPQEIYLDGFWMDKTEVTLGKLGKCVEAGVCGWPVDRDWYSRNYKEGWALDYSQPWISWQQAQDYCEWVGGSLPSEAQWEKAATAGDGRMWPWGNASPNPDNMISYSEKWQTPLAKTGSLPGSASPYGVLDMIGGLYEWVLDWYDKDYYRTRITPGVGPDFFGESKVVRGGYFVNEKVVMQGYPQYYSWVAQPYYSTYARDYIDPNYGYIHIGFRCVIPEN